jgi:hypothetical protein
MPLVLMRHVIAAAVLALPSARLHAQATSLVTLRADSVRRRLPIDASRLRPTRVHYRAAVTQDSTALFTGDVQFEVAEMQYTGAPALLLVQTGMLGTTTMSDSLVVSRADLRPLHWSAAQGVARLAAEFTPDTIFGAMSSPLGRQNIVIANRADLLVSAAAVDAVLTSLPLSLGWRDSVHVLVVDAGGATTAPATIAVDAEERVVVPAGEYDCWVVSLETERGSARYWVSKEQPLIVRSEQILPQIGGAVLTRELSMAEVVVPPG